MGSWEFAIYWTILAIFALWMGVTMGFWEFMTIWMLASILGAIVWHLLLTHGRKNWD